MLISFICTRHIIKILILIQLFKNIITRNTKKACGIAYFYCLICPTFLEFTFYFLSKKQLSTSQCLIRVIKFVYIGMKKRKTAQHQL